MGNARIPTADTVSTSLPTEIAPPSDTLQPSPTASLSYTPTPNYTPTPGETPVLTTPPLLEQVGVVILDGREIGTIQKSGKKFQYTANPSRLIPEVRGKVVLKIIDPQETWGFNLESSSSPMYILKDDPRCGWEAYGVLAAYQGSHEIAVRFIALNVRSWEKIKGKVSIEIVGAAVIATDTPEMGWYPVP